MITKEIVEEFFNDLKNGEEFDTSDKLLWGFFFLDTNKKKLERASEKLAEKGYRYVQIFEAEKENKEDVTEYYLHVEKIEYHDVDSLDKRNGELYLFAEQNGISGYDGFDVGNVISSESVVK